MIGSQAPTSHDEIVWAHAHELAEATRSGRLSVREVAEAMIARVDEVDPLIGALVWWDPSQVLADARALDEASARGRAPGPLHGVPFTVKDLTPMRGVPVTSGITAFADHIGAVDAPVVERLRAAGGLFLGRTNTPEAGYAPKTSNHLFGPTRNPWDRADTVGGSSGGAAAAVAAGLGPIAEGSDGGGSIRVPAALTGVVGMKPSTGRIPKVSGTQRFATHSVHGPLTRSVADAALMLDVTCGADPRDPLSRPGPDAPFSKRLSPDLRGWRVAYSPTLGIDTQLDPEVAALTRAGAARLAEAGAEVDECEPAWGDGAEAMWDGVWVPGIAGLAEQVDVAAMHGRLDDELIEIIRSAHTLTGDRVARADVARGRFYDEFERFMRGYRILASPTTAVAGFDVERFNPPFLDGYPLRDRLLRWSLTWPFNLTGTPAISVPCGFTGDGRPVGLQLAARPHADQDALDAAYAFEHVGCRPSDRHPTLTR